MAARKSTRPGERKPGKVFKEGEGDRPPTHRPKPAPRPSKPKQK
ncbi:hypothetical protein ES702_00437 [subsurface metagenome]